MEPEDLQEYDQPHTCEWEKDGIKCKKEVHENGYCLEHSKIIAEQSVIGAMAGGGIGVVTVNPWLIAAGAVVGAALAVYLLKKGK